MDINTNQTVQPKQSMNPMMIGAVVIGVLLLGGYALFANKGSGSATQVVPTQTTQVTQKATITTPTSSPLAENVKEFTMTAKKFEFSRQALR